MHGSQYRLIAEHPLRQALRSVVNDPRDVPTKSALRAAIVEALPDAPAEVIDALMTKATEFAQAAANDPGARFDLRGAADRLCLHVVETLEKDDRLVATEEPEPVDVGATLEAMENPAERALKAIESRLIDTGGHV